MEAVGMQLWEVSPFVRFARTIRYRGAGERVFAPDYRLFLVLLGEGHITVEKECHPLQADCLVLLPPGTVYSFDLGTVQQLIVLNFDLNWSRSSIQQVMPRIRAGEGSVPADCPQVTDCPMLSQPLYITGGQGYRDELTHIIGLLTRQPRYFREEAGTVLKGLLLRMVQHAAAPEDRARQVLDDLIRYLQRHYAESITAESLSQRFSYSSHHLNRLMQRSLGSTVHQYLLRCRITMAQRLLLETDDPIGQIARQVGFAHFAHFSSCFLRITGCRPGEYRQLVCGKAAPEERP